MSVNKCWENLHPEMKMYLGKKIICGQKEENYSMAGPVIHFISNMCIWDNQQPERYAYLQLESGLFWLIQLVWKCNSAYV